MIYYSVEVWVSQTSCRDLRIMSERDIDHFDPYERVEEDNPERCQNSGKTGQCNLRAVPGGTHCVCHGGVSQIEVQRNKKLNNYRLTKFQARLERHAGSDNIKSLREEIGILRMVLEEKLNACDDLNSLIYMAAPVSELVLKIEKLVVSCHKLEGSMGQHLDKASILQFAQEVIMVISNILDPLKFTDQLEQISSEVLKIVGRLGEES